MAVTPFKGIQGHWFRPNWHSSGQNMGTWQTDGRSDRQTDLWWVLQRFALRAMRTRCNKIECKEYC